MFATSVMEAGPSPAFDAVARFEAVAPFEAVDGDVAEQRAMSVRVERCWASFEHARHELLDAIGDWDRASASALDAVSSRSWLRYRLATTSGEATRLLELARRLVDHPVIAEALHDGSLTTAKAEIILQSFTEPRRPWADRDAAMLAGEAARLTCSSVLKMMRFWAARADAARAYEDPADPHDDRTDPADTDHADTDHIDTGEALSGTAHIAAGFDGITELQATLSPEAGATVEAAIELAMAEDRRRRRAEAGLGDSGENDDEAGREDATTTTAPPDPRTPAQRRADALVMIAEFFLAHATTTATVHGERPKVVVTIDLPTLVGDRAGLAAIGSRSGLISAEAARRRCCDAGVARVITNGASVVIDLGRTTRCISPQLRTAIVTRDHCCRFPGCGARARFGEIHHIVHWGRGGPTDRTNLVLLCWRHHRVVHHGWTISGDPNAVLHFRAPDGTVYATGPPGPWGP